VLHRQGLHLVSWTRRGFDTRDRRPERVLARLTHGLRRATSCSCTTATRSAASGGRPVLLDVLPPLFERCRAAGLQAVTLAETLPQRGAAP